MGKQQCRSVKCGALRPIFPDSLKTLVDPTRVTYYRSDTEEL